MPGEASTVPRRKLTGLSSCAAVALASDWPASRPSPLLVQVKQPATALAEHELVTIDQVVEHLHGDGGEAAQAGAVFAGGQGVGSKLSDSAAVAFPLLLGNGDLGFDDGLFQFLKLGLVAEACDSISVWRASTSLANDLSSASSLAKAAPWLSMSS